MDNSTTKDQKEQTPKEQFDEAMEDLRAIIQKFEAGHWSKRYAKMGQKDG